MDNFKEFTVSTARPLPVVILADVSGSMQEHGKIQALNLAVREMLDTFRTEDRMSAEIHVAVVTFGGAARMHINLQPASKVTWADMTANDSTPLGAAIDLARQLLEDRNTLPSRAYRPTVVLVSDGQPNPGDGWQEALTALLTSERGKKAQRMAVGIGPDADMNVLKQFVGTAEGKVHQAQDARQIREFFQFVTMSVTSRSRSAAPNTIPQPSVELDF
jgi:uncharacterized protein YegL